MVRLKHVPFTDQEREELRTLDRLTRQAAELFDYFFNESGIEIDRLVNKDLMVYYQVLSIYREYVDGISELVNQFSRPAFAYIHRDELLVSFLKKWSYPKHIRFEFKGEYQQVDYPFPSINMTDKPVTESIIRHLHDMLDDIERIENEVDRMLESKLRQARLLDREKHLIKKRDSLVSLYSNAFEDEAYNAYHRQVAARVLDYSTTAFEGYANLGLQEKIDTIDHFISCYESFIQLYHMQTTIPAKLKRLDEAYTRTVWNPYTMTDMQERMKERVYQAFETHVLPYYFKDMESSINCRDIAGKLSDFEIIYRKMMELREQDTKDVERSLRGLNSPTRILQVLNINLHGN
jgi:hypothetical protein